MTKWYTAKKKEERVKRGEQGSQEKIFDKFEEREKK
jgi:hypothetical protein